MIVAAFLMLQTADALATYHAKTDAGPRCAHAAGDDVLVCGRREADRYRVPLVEPAAGDPAHESVAAERQRLQAPTNNCAEKSAFLVECGMVGVGVSSQHGVRTGQERPIAP